MIKNGIITDINSKYILKQVFSFLQLNIYYKIIKYNKMLQKRLNISLEDELFNSNYSFSLKSKSEIESDITEMQRNLNSILLPFEKFEIGANIMEIQRNLNILEKPSKPYSIPSRDLVMLHISFTSKFCLKYSYPFEVNLHEKDKEFMFLIK